MLGYVLCQHSCIWRYRFRGFNLFPNTMSNTWYNILPWPFFSLFFCKFLNLRPLAFRSQTATQKYFCSCCLSICGKVKRWTSPTWSWKVLSGASVWFVLSGRLWPLILRKRICTYAICMMSSNLSNTFIHPSRKEPKESIWKREATWEGDWKNFLFIKFKLTNNILSCQFSQVATAQASDWRIRCTSTPPDKSRCAAAFRQTLATASRE